VDSQNQFNHMVDSHKQQNHLTTMVVEHILELNKVFEKTFGILR
jgi:hypothetical protein